MGTNDLVVPDKAEVTASPVMSPKATAIRLSKFIPTAFLSSSSRLLLSSASSSDGESKIAESTNSSSSSDGDGGRSNNDWEEDFFLSSPTTMRKGLQLSGAIHKNVGQLQVDTLSCLIDDGDSGSNQNQ